MPKEKEEIMENEEAQQAQEEAPQEEIVFGVQENEPDEAPAVNMPAGEEEVPAEDHSEEEKRFNEVINRRAEEEARFTEEFIKEAEKRAKASKYEQSKFNQKRMIGDMVRYYAVPASTDSDLMAILKDVKALSVRNDGAYFGSVPSESKKYNSILAALNAYMAKLAEEEKEIGEESRRYFKNEDGSWLDQGTIEDDPELRQKDRELVSKQRLNDDRRRIAADLSHFLEGERDGHLFITEEERKTARFIDTRGMNFNTRFKSGSGAFLDWGTGLSYKWHQTNAALFSHEPSANDIKQGMIGDCYFVQALSDIARLYPEKIKESMRDNNDGTVTVRLYSKDKDGNYAPIFVTVDKVVPMIGGVFTEGAYDSVWANCYERALAAAGINASSHSRENSWKVVPENIQQIYNGFAEKKKRGEAITDEEIKENPWIFGEDKELIPWPNYNSIAGGQGGEAAEMILGPGFQKFQVDIDSGIYGKSEFLTVKGDSFSALNLAEISIFSGDLLTRKEKPKKDYTFASDTEELVEKYINQFFSGGAAAPEIVEDYRTFVRIFTREVMKLTDKGGSLLEIYARLNNDFKEKKFPEDLPQSMIGPYRSAGEELKKACVLAYRETVGREVYEMSKEAGEKGYVACAGSRHKSPDGKPFSVADGHEYSILGAYTDEATGKKYIRLRNPWGEIGSFAQLLAGGSALVEETDKKGRTTVSFKSDKDGIFDMELEMFLHDMDRIQINGISRGLQHMEMSGKSSYIDFRTTDTVKDKERVKQVLIHEYLDMQKTKTSKVVIPEEDIDGETFEKIMTDMEVETLGEGADEESKKFFTDLNKEVAKSTNDILNEIYDAVSEKHPGGMDEDALNELYDALQEKSSELSNIIENTPQKVSGRLDNIADMVESLIATYKLCKNSEAFYEKVCDTLAKEDRPQLFIASDNNQVITGKNNLPEIIGAHKGDDGRCYFTIKVEGGRTYDKEALDVYNVNSHLIERPVEKAVEIAEEAVQEPVNTVETAEYATVRNYLKAVNDVYLAFKETDSMLSKDSERYKNLKKSLEQARISLAGCSGKSMDAVSDIMSDVRESLGFYKARLLEQDTKGSRRQAREKICEVLTKICDSANMKIDDPCFEMQQDLAKRMLKAHPSYKGKDIPEEQMDALAKKFADDKSFRSTFGNQNICRGKFYGDKQIAKCLETYQEQNKDFSRLKNKDVVEKVMREPVLNL